MAASRSSSLRCAEHRLLCHEDLILMLYMICLPGLPLHVLQALSIPRRCLTRLFLLQGLRCKDPSGAVHAQIENPKAEEVECLCKLMSTIGHLLDAGTSKKSAERMDAYFSRMQKVKEAQSLESRHRFMIQVSTHPCWRASLTLPWPAYCNPANRDAHHGMEGRLPLFSTRLGSTWTYTATLIWKTETEQASCRLTPYPRYAGRH